VKKKVFARPPSKQAPLHTVVQVGLSATPNIVSETPSLVGGNVADQIPELALKAEDNVTALKTKFSSTGRVLKKLIDIVLRFQK